MALPIWFRLFDFRRKQHRRGVHPRYELAATAGESSARSLQKRQVDHLVGASWRALPTLGDELEMSQAPSASDSSRDGSGSGIQKQPSRPTEGRQVSEKSAFSFPRGNEFTKENTSEEPETSKRRQSESAATNINEMDLKAPLIEAVATSEQSATGAKQIAYSSGVVNADIPAVRRPRDSHPGASVSDTELLFVRWVSSKSKAILCLSSLLVFNPSGCFRELNTLMLQYALSLRQQMVFPRNQPLPQAFQKLKIFSVRKDIFSPRGVCLQRERPVSELL